MIFDWPLFAIFLVTCFTAGSTGAMYGPDEWYDRISKPPWTPPNWLFPTAWFTLYLLMSYSAMRVGLSDDPNRVYALAIWGLQTAFNTLWSPIFFGQHKIGAALIALMGLWASVIAMAVSFWMVDRIAGLVILPYVVWGSYAFALNFSIWLRNRGTTEPAGA